MFENLKIGDIILEISRNKRTLVKVTKVNDKTFMIEDEERLINKEKPTLKREWYNIYYEIISETEIEIIKEKNKIRNQKIFIKDNINTMLDKLTLEELEKLRSLCE